MQDNDIKILIKILEESDIDELEVSSFWGRRKIRLRKTPAVERQHFDVNNNMQNIKPVNENIPETQSMKVGSDDLLIPDPLDTSIEQESQTLPENTVPTLNTSF